MLFYILHIPDHKMHSGFIGNILGKTASLHICATHIQWCFLNKMSVHNILLIVQHKELVTRVTFVIANVVIFRMHKLSVPLLIHICEGICNCLIPLTPTNFSPICTRDMAVNILCSSYTMVCCSHPYGPLVTKEFFKRFFIEMSNGCSWLVRPPVFPATYVFSSATILHHIWPDLVTH